MDQKFPSITEFLYPIGQRDGSVGRLFSMIQGKFCHGTSMGFVSAMRVPLLCSRSPIYHVFRHHLSDSWPY